MAEEKKDISVTFSCPPDLHAKLVADAEDGDRNLSQQVKRVVRLHYASLDSREQMPTK